MILITSGPLLLDTRVLVRLIVGDKFGLAIDAHYGLRKLPDRPLIALASVAELRRRSLRRTTGWTSAQRNELEALLHEFVWVEPNNESVLSAYAGIGAHLDDNLSAIPDVKLWVAASASAARAKLLTYDTDYRYIPDSLLSVEFIERGEVLPEEPVDV